MAVAHDAWAESHTGTTGSTSEASFTWNHVGGGSARAACVAVYTNANADYITSVTYGGVTMRRVPGGQAIDTTTEPMRVDIFWLDSCGTGTKAVVVTRTNNATIMTAQSVTVTVQAGWAACITKIVLTQNNQATAVVAVDDGSPGTNSQRYGFLGSGIASAITAGTGSTAMGAIVLAAAESFNGFQETTPGQGSRNVGGSNATSDDTAGVYLSVSEYALITSRLDSLIAARSGLVAYFPMNEQGGLTGVARDLSSNANHAVPTVPSTVTSPSWSRGVAAMGFMDALDKGTLFVAANSQRFAAAHIGAYDLGTGDYSITGWFTGGVDPVAEQRMLGFGAPGPGGDGYEMYHGDGGKYLTSRIDTVQANTNNPAFTAWTDLHFIAFTMARSGNGTAWVDGVSQNALSIAADSAQSVSAGTSMFLGATSTPDKFADRSLAKIAVYNRVLTDAEITQEWAAGKFFSLGRRPRIPAHVYR